MCNPNPELIPGNWCRTTRLCQVKTRPAVQLPTSRLTFVVSSFTALSIPLPAGVRNEHTHCRSHTTDRFFSGKCLDSQNVQWRSVPGLLTGVSVGHFVADQSSIDDCSRDLLIEAKPDADKGSIRIAIGQLFDYARHRTRQPATELVVLTISSPAPDYIDLLNDLASQPSGSAMKIARRSPGVRARRGRQSLTQ